ncbi:MAG TPA: hypothetical protein VGG89_07100 [Candidatus Baltobacteraceae bacterium]|jgi:hypothetical protein
MNRAAWLLALPIALTSCSGVTPSVASGSLRVAHARALVEPSAPYVYVANSGFASGSDELPSVVVFPPNGRTPRRTFASTSTVELGDVIALDARGALFVPQGPAGAATTPYSINVFAPGSKRLQRNITYGAELVNSMAFDHRGNLYVAYQRLNNYVIEYARKKSAVREISTGASVPGRLAVDSKDNLYVQTDNALLVFAPGSSTLPLRIIKHLPKAAKIGTYTIDRSNNVYVSYYFGNGSQGVVDVYASGSTHPAREISGLNPCQLATDTARRLYSLQCRADLPQSISIFAPGSSTAERTITSGLVHPSSIAVDPSGYLYVTNYGPYNNKNNYVDSSVTVYAPGQSAPLRTIERDLAQPVQIVFGSQ